MKKYIGRIIQKRKRKELTKNKKQKIYYEQNRKVHNINFESISF